MLNCAPSGIIKNETEGGEQRRRGVHAKTDDRSRRACTCWRAWRNRGRYDTEPRNRSRHRGHWQDLAREDSNAKHCRGRFEEGRWLASGEIDSVAFRRRLEPRHRATSGSGGRGSWRGSRCSGCQRPATGPLSLDGRFHLGVAPCRRHWLAAPEGHLLSLAGPIGSAYKSGQLQPPSTVCFAERLWTRPTRPLS